MDFTRSICRKFVVGVSYPMTLILTIDFHGDLSDLRHQFPLLLDLFKICEVGFWVCK
jgi:hypothetical protein